VPGGNSASLGPGPQAKPSSRRSTIRLFAVTKVVTGLADRASFATFKPVESKVTFLS
jgi:hypothetical protein